MYICVTNGVFQRVTIPVAHDVNSRSSSFVVLSSSQLYDKASYAIELPIQATLMELELKSIATSRLQG